LGHHPILPRRDPGDPSGGRHLGPPIAEAYGLDGAGVSPRAFRTRYRESLDQVAFTPDDEGNFLAGVAEACRLDIAVLRELKERWQ
jgi:hypothetical protein